MAAAPPNLSEEARTSAARMGMKWNHRLGKWDSPPGRAPTKVTMQHMQTKTDTVKTEAAGAAAAAPSR